MLVVGFDTETTGLNVHEDHIIEMGAVLWDTDRKAPLQVMSRLIHHKNLQALDPKITDLTGIRFDDLTLYGVDFVSANEEFLALCEQADWIVAHNGNLFDKPIYFENCKRYVAGPAKNSWIDTSCDIEFPGDVTTRRLKHLAAEHGFLNPFAHRAVFDVLTMLKVCEDYDWNQIVTYAKAPTVVIKAETNFHQKELAKKQNYRWDNENKMWTKSVKDFQLDDARKAAKEAGFNLTVLKGG